MSLKKAVTCLVSAGPGSIVLLARGLASPKPSKSPIMFLGSYLLELFWEELVFLSLHCAPALSTTCLIDCSYQTCREALSLQIKTVSAELQCGQQLLAPVSLVLGDAVRLSQALQTLSNSPEKLFAHGLFLEHGACCLG